MPKPKKPEAPSRHLEIRQRIRDQEAVRVTIIHCLDMLRPLREKVANALPDDIVPRGMAMSWLGTAELNLEVLLRRIAEHEL